MAKCEFTVAVHKPKGKVILLDVDEVPPQNAVEVKHDYIKTKDEWDKLYADIIEANPHYRDRFNHSISCYYGRSMRIDIAEEMLIDEIEEDFESRFRKPFNVYWQMTDDEFNELNKEVQEWMEY